MSATRPPDTEAREALARRLERGLMAAPVEAVMRRFELTFEELRDLCPDMVERADDHLDDRSDVSGY